MLIQSKLDKYTFESNTTTDFSRDVIWMANGSSDATRAAYRGGAIIGYEAKNCRPPEDIDVEFIDFPFTKVTEDNKWSLVDEYVAVVRNESPTYAVLPDVNQDFTEAEVLEVSKDIKSYVDTQILIPKEIHPSTVDDRYRVGVPCQRKFSQAKWDPDDYTECDELHLLGGSPHTHYEWIYETDCTVKSVDTSVPLSSAQWGDVWVLKDGEPYWGSDSGGVYGCLEKSFINICKILNRDNDSSCVTRKYITKPDYGRYQECGYPDRDLLRPDEEQPFAGRQYYEQMSYTRF